MNRYDGMFVRLREQSAGAFVPFVMLGDPGTEATLAIVDALVAGGADALEVGLPFSDPVADGVRIQHAAKRALDAGMTPTKAFDLLAEIRARHADIPIGVLTYANLVVHRGIAAFCRALAEAGTDSLLIADVPGVESEPFAHAALDAGIAPILIVPPNATDATFATIAQWGRGYSYVLGRAGVTGTDVAMQTPANALIQRLAACGAPPAMIGFGISTPGHVRDAIAAGAAGAIAGSAIVAIIEQHRTDMGACAAELTRFTATMVSAARGAQVM